MKRLLTALCASVLAVSSCAGKTTLYEDEPFDPAQTVVVTLGSKAPDTISIICYYAIDDSYAFGDEFDVIAVGTVSNVREYACIMKQHGTLSRSEGTFFDFTFSRVIGSKNGDAPAPGSTVTVATGLRNRISSEEADIRDGIEVLLFAARTDTDHMRATEHFRFEDYAEYWANDPRLISERDGDFYIVSEYLAALVSGGDGFRSGHNPDLPGRDALLRQFKYDTAYDVEVCLDAVLSRGDLGDSIWPWYLVFTRLFHIAGTGELETALGQKAKTEWGK